jgi:hypothetical protein
MARMRFPGRSAGGRQRRRWNPIGISPDRASHPGFKLGFNPGINAGLGLKLGCRFPHPPAPEAITIMMMRLGPLVPGWFGPLGFC